MENLLNSLFANESISIPARTIIVEEGALSDKFFLIKKGSVRAWYKSFNKEVTVHLFFENNLFMAVESFLFGEASMYNLETIENCELTLVTKEEFDSFLNKNKNVKDELYQTLLKRTLVYSKWVIELLKTKSEERYKKLIARHAQIVDRVPLNIIASYLGITSVSLSRIRTRQEEEEK